MLARVTVEANALSPSWLLNPSWADRVREFERTFQGSGWFPTCGARIAASRAVVYLQPTTGATISERQAGELRNNWSGRVAGLSVEGVEPVEECRSQAADLADARLDPIGMLADLVGRVFGEAGKAVAVPAAIAAVIVGGFLVYRATARGGR